MAEISIEQIGFLENSIKNVCPIECISFGKRDDKSTWRITFSPEATNQQKLDAQAIVDNLDLSSPLPDGLGKNNLVVMLSERDEEGFDQFLKSLNDLPDEVRSTFELLLPLIRGK